MMTDEKSFAEKWEDVVKDTPHRKSHDDYLDEVFMADHNGKPLTRRRVYHCVNHHDTLVGALEQVISRLSTHEQLPAGWKPKKALAAAKGEPDV